VLAVTLARFDLDAAPFVIDAQLPRAVADDAFAAIGAGENLQPSSDAEKAGNPAQYDAPVFLFRHLALVGGGCGIRPALAASASAGSKRDPRPSHPCPASTRR